MRKSRVVLVLIGLLTLPLMSYVGPGAGFVFLGSFFFIFIAFFLALFQLITLPFRATWRYLRRLQHMQKARFRRVIIIGFDGMDHRLLQSYRKQGESFPRFDRLEKDGTGSPLWSTEPPISPVAWSTFATGVNPGKHNIFDFLTSDRKNYMPKLSGSDVIPSDRILRLGKWEIPLKSPKIELMRKSQSFWKILSKKGIFSAVLRLPYSFPPEKIFGLMLSGLGTPDLRGTQGSFTYFADSPPGDLDISDGLWEKLEKKGENTYSGTIRGPAHPFLKTHPPLTIPFTLQVKPESGEIDIRIDKKTITIKKGEFSPWHSLRFRAGFTTVSGIAQWVPVSLDPLRIYLSPIHIDPDRPVMPISHPRILSVYLAKMLGPYATLGMAEDTWALNENILNERQFLTQVYQAQEERERIFFDTLKKTKEGLIVQVFETTDRVQHTFWRYFPDSRSAADRDSKDTEIKTAILQSYKKMDDFLGRLMPRMKKDDLLMIVSDHGFGPFDREFHLNSWLLKEGYLELKDGKTESGKFFADVNWSRSRAYGMGLNGIFLNMAGRESEGIVRSGEEAENLKKEIKEKLMALKDPSTGTCPFRAVFTREEIYRGPYVENAPDLIIGYNRGYRISWESAVNIVSRTLFSDNRRRWSGDHSFTRDQVPGVFFCNRRIKQKDPGLIDISPTVLAAFGIPAPSFIDGRDLQVQ